MKNKMEAPNPNRNPLQKQKKLNEIKKTPQAVQQATHAKAFWLFFSFRSIPFGHGFVQ
jgi:hypothetical protein